MMQILCKLWPLALPRWTRKCRGQPATSQAQLRGAANLPISSAPARVNIRTWDVKYICCGPNIFYFQDVGATRKIIHVEGGLSDTQGERVQWTIEGAGWWWYIGEDGMEEIKILHDGTWTWLYKYIRTMQWSKLLIRINKIMNSRIFFMKPPISQDCWSIVNDLLQPILWH